MPHTWTWSLGPRPPTPTLTHKGGGRTATGGGRHEVGRPFGSLPPWWGRVGGLGDERVSAECRPPSPTLPHQGGGGKITGDGERCARPSSLDRFSRGRGSAAGGSSAAGRGSSATRRSSAAPGRAAAAVPVAGAVGQ